MKKNDSLRSYTQRLLQLVGKLTTAPPANMQMEWFIAGLPELLDFEVQKADPQSLSAAIDIAKKYEKSALLSGRWTEKKQPKKKVTFVDEDDSDELIPLSEDKPTLASKTQSALLTRVVKDEMKTLKDAIEDVKVQMADIKKTRKPLPSNRTNVWCTRCKKEGHFSHDCQADWRMIQETEVQPHETELIEMEQLFAIQQRAMRADLENRSSRCRSI